jgi:hypothetical protein
MGPQQSLKKLLGQLQGGWTGLPTAHAAIVTVATREQVRGNLSMLCTLYCRKQLAWFTLAVC